MEQLYFITIYNALCYYVSLYANALWVVQYKNFLNFQLSEPLVGYE